MSQQVFEQFMADQMAAIVAAGIETDEGMIAWIESNGASFRASWEASHNVH